MDTNFDENQLLAFGRVVNTFPFEAHDRLVKGLTTIYLSGANLVSIGLTRDQLAILHSCLSLALQARRENLPNT